MIESAAPKHHPRVPPDANPLPAPPTAAVLLAPATPARLRALVAEHFVFIWRLIRRLGLPPADADDGAQQVFLVATERIADIACGSERSFLFGTALRVAAARRRAVVRERPGDAVDTADSVQTPDELTHQKRLREMLDAILDQMDGDLRVVFILVEIEGLTAPEVSRLLKVPAGTVASRLRRAREAFEAEIKRLQTRMGFRAGGRP